MRVLIFEDEALSSEQLVRMLSEYDKDIQVLDVIESVKQGIAWFQKNDYPDLVFMDIHLADGSCFELFSSIDIEAPIIFTTAYDQYAIQAFKVNSVDYLLKPIDFDDLATAIDKFKRIGKLSDNEKVVGILQQITKEYKQRFLVNKGDEIFYVNTEDISYIVYDEAVVFAYTMENKRYMLDQSIEKLSTLLDPSKFYRINRKMIVSLKGISKIHRYFTSRLKLELIPEAPVEAIVSREKVSDFKKWLDS